MSFMVDISGLHPTLNYPYHVRLNQMLKRIDTKSCRLGSKALLLEASDVNMFGKWHASVK